MDDPDLQEDTRVASTRRDKELARLRAERQAARRAAEAARRKRRNTVVASTLAVLLVAGGAAYVATRGGSTTKTAAAPKTPAPSTGAPAAAPPSGSAAPGACTYSKAGTASRQVQLPPAQPARTPVKATITTDQGVLGLTLAGDKAPCATGAIVSLAGQHFYDGTPCHRLTTEGIFVLQCGDPSGTGSGGSGYQYKEEDLTGATYKRGTVAMAKTSEPGTTGSQFFLVYKDSQLPPQYTPVGTITTGLDVLDKVAAAGSEPAGDGKPKLPVTIKTFTTAPV